MMDPNVQGFAQVPFCGCWVQHGSERRQSQLNWLSGNCEDRPEMQIVRFAKYVGTMIGPDGHLHRWSTLPKNSYNAY